MLCIYNTFSRKKEKFQSKTPGKVAMYVCGPTVYSELHIGNFRGAVFFNLVRHYLEYLGYEVAYAYNYTDIDDKIIQQAKKEKISAKEVAEKYIGTFERDFNRLKLTKHTHNPRATDFIPQMIGIIEKLIERNKAYVVEGEVFYAIDRFEGYGGLSGKKTEELIAGERIQVDPKKRNPLDFVLWKPARTGEPSWPSPWGEGRPGWHMECTAMIRDLLGESIDIHGGGMDLIFPHHENEIAQGEGCCRETYCRYWMHNNLIQIDDKKMSKSLGNIISARRFMDEYHEEILKYMILSVHYRSTLNISEEAIELSVSELSRIYRTLHLARQIKSQGVVLEKNDSFKEELDKAFDRVKNALDDDFNTCDVFAQVFLIVRMFNGLDVKDVSCADAFLNWMDRISKWTSLFDGPPEIFLRVLDDIWLGKRNLNREEIDRLFKERNKAREGKDFKKADLLRRQLSDWGIDIHDSKEGSYWEVRKGGLS